MFARPAQPLDFAVTSPVTNARRNVDVRRFVSRGKGSLELIYSALNSTNCAGYAGQAHQNQNAVNEARTSPRRHRALGAPLTPDT